MGRGRFTDVRFIESTQLTVGQKKVAEILLVKKTCSQTVVPAV